MKSSWLLVLPGLLWLGINASASPEDVIIYPTEYPLVNGTGAVLVQPTEYPLIPTTHGSLIHPSDAALLPTGVPLLNPFSAPLVASGASDAQ